MCDVTDDDVAQSFLGASHNLNNAMAGEKESSRLYVVPPRANETWSFVSKEVYTVARTANSTACGQEHRYLVH